MAAPLASPTFALRSGDRMPLLGLGTWLAPKGAVAAAVTAAIRCGYRAIDCAAMYQNEAEVGEGITAAVAEGGVKREDLFITSKLPPNQCHADAVEAAVDKSIAELKVGYLDLYLIHWPFFLRADVPSFPPPPEYRIPYSPDAYIAVWQVLEGLVAAGKIRNLGVSNMSAKKLHELMPRMTVLPAACQVECHPCFAQRKLLDYCRRHSIALTAYSPLGNPDRPERLKAPGDATPLAEPAVIDLAAEKGCSPAQVLLAWALKRGTCCIPKSVTESRIIENFGSIAIAASLTDADMARIDALDRADGRIVKGLPFVLEGQTWQELWDEEWAEPL